METFANSAFKEQADMMTMALRRILERQGEVQFWWGGATVERVLSDSTAIKRTWELTVQVRQREESGRSKILYIAALSRFRSPNKVQELTCCN